MILLHLDRNNKKPVYAQIFEQIKEMIDTSVLTPGTVLPSTRRLAEKLGVNRSTVFTAYQELWGQGYIEGKTGACTTVRRRVPAGDDASRVDDQKKDWDSRCTRGSRDTYEIFKGFRPETANHINGANRAENVINLAQLDMDERLFPVDDFRRCMNRVLLRQGSGALGYGEYSGYFRLRETIAQRLRFHRISTSPEQVLITNGSQDGLELVLKVLGVKGKKIVIESPTYAIILPLLKYFGLETAPVPMTAKGMDLDYLEHVFQKEEISFLYTMPNFHNPTGVTTAQSHREALIELCREYGVPIVEDGFEEEMKYFGKVPPPIKSMDRYGDVIYLGTFSKVLFPGVRIGWVAADADFTQRLTAVKRFSDLTSSPLLQAAVDEFCRGGFYTKHLKKMHRVFRKRMQTALTAMKQFLPTGKVSWNEPGGGYLIWFKLNGCSADEPELIKTFLENGIVVSPGRYYFQTEPDEKFFRISISTLDEHEITEGIERLGNAIRNLY